MNCFKESEFVSLCQDVMTGKSIMNEQEFLQEVTETLFVNADPITKKILTENIKKLYAFLITMLFHPMRVSLSHAMTKTYLDMIRVNSDDISNLFAKHNKAYTLVHDEEATIRAVNTCKCPYDGYHEHILGKDRPTKGVGTVKVILIYRDGDEQYITPSGVKFKLNIPFKSVRKIMYVDITNNVNKPKGKKSKVFVNTGYGRFKFVDVYNDDTFNVKSPIGQTLSSYYKMWRVKEAFLKEIFSDFVQPVTHMFFTN